MQSWINRFLDYGRVNLGYSECTIKGYRSDLRGFSAWLADAGVTDPAQVQRGHIERYDVAQGVLGRRPMTRRRKIAAIRAFTGWLLDEEHALAADPARKLKLPALDDAERHAPTAREKAQLFDGALRLESAYECALAVMTLAVMFYAGLRPMEAQALELTDVDLAKRVLTVQKGKGRKRREVPINETLAAHVAAWLPVRRTPRIGTPLLVTTQHRAMSYHVLRTTFNRVKIAGGLRAAKGLTAHCLRHWFASTLYHNKTDMEVIRKLLGHASLNTTSLYLHQMGNELQDAVRGLDAADIRPAAVRIVRAHTHRRA